MSGTLKITIIAAVAAALGAAVSIILLRGPAILADLSAAITAFCL